MITDLKLFRDFLSSYNWKTTLKKETKYKNDTELSQL